MANFGDWLFEARKNARLSQEELAERAGISKNYVSTLERNLPNYKTGAPPQPSRKVVEAIAIGLSVPVPEAFAAAGYTVDPLEVSDEEIGDEEAIAYYRGIPPNLKPAARAILKTMFEQSDRAETTHGKKAE